MKYYFLNPQSCSGLALKKWVKLQDHMDLKDAKIIDNFYQIDWDEFIIHPGDSFISAGGDGTLHSMVNALIKFKGIQILQAIKVGHIGLGSNNSFLRPYDECTFVNGIPMKVSEITYLQDLMEVEVENGAQNFKVYCVANSSLGFLATANILFNGAADIAVIKKWNSDLADVYTFIRALINWKPIEIEYVIDSVKSVRSITNMHFMKRPFYATDLGFPEHIPENDGKFRFNVLWARGAFVILKKFFSMMVFKDLLQGRDFTATTSNVLIRSQNAIPIELDGEIYYGLKFNVVAFKGGINLCK